MENKAIERLLQESGINYQSEMFNGSQRLEIKNIAIILVHDKEICVQYANTYACLPKKETSLKWLKWWINSYVKEQA